VFPQQTANHFLNKSATENSLSPKSSLAMSFLKEFSFEMQEFKEL